MNILLLDSTYRHAISSEFFTHEDFLLLLQRIAIMLALHSAGLSIMSILLQRTIQLLKETDIPLRHLAREMGCNVATLSLLRNRPEPYIPNVALCEKLYVRLSGKQLEL